MGCPELGALCSNTATKPKALAEALLQPQGSALCPQPGRPTLFELWSNEGKSGVSVGSFSLFQERLRPRSVFWVSSLQPQNRLAQHSDPEQEAALQVKEDPGLGAGGAVSSGGRQEHFNTGTLTDCPRTSPPNRPTLRPTPLPCLPAPLHLLIPSPGLHLVWCAWDIWENSVREVGENSEPFPNKTKRLRLRARETHSPRSPRRGGGPVPKGARRFTLSASCFSQTKQSSMKLTPKLHPSPPAPHTPTSAPTDLPTSCHCLGSNPSSAPAAWRARPGQGAAGTQGRPLMPRRVRGPGLRAGLGPRASTAEACLFASCRLQKPEELIKNRWAGRGSSGCRPGPQPQLFPA